LFGSSNSSTAKLLAYDNTNPGCSHVMLVNLNEKKGDFNSTFVFPSEIKEYMAEFPQNTS
jgi:hypothetical protein